MKNNYFSVYPRKRYKRYRLKWLLLFVLFGILIILSGKKGKEIEENPEERYEEISESETISEKDDFQYLAEYPDIRVILQSGNYSGLYHAKIEVTFPMGGYVLICKNDHWEKQEVKKGESVSIGIGKEFDYSITRDMLIAMMSHEKNQPLVVNSIERNRTTCSYFGRLEVSLENAGLLLINALSLEQYLCSVVPSEMPASYEKEALKAQAILARTYAYKYLIKPAYPDLGAHVDDSIAFQVYGNIDNNAITDKAVVDTSGIILFYDKSIAEVYYYSTSCGYGTDGSAWGHESYPYLKATRIGSGELKSADGSLQGKEAEEYYLEALRKEQIFRNMITNPFINGYEEKESWYRWSVSDVELNHEVILKRLKERYELNSNIILTKKNDGTFESKKIKTLGNIKNIYVESRGAGGICESLIIEGSDNTYKVLLEYNIRYVLNGNGVTVTRADGTDVFCSMLLPSGFFYLDNNYFGKNIISYNIYGGGYGHGVGLSQNGANQMAKQGLTCQEIIGKFFPGTVFVSYGNSN